MTTDTLECAGLTAPFPAAARRDESELAGRPAVPSQSGVKPPHSKDLDAITLTEWEWKTPAMKAMTLAACHLALARGILGKFSALDLPVHGESEQGGSGIAGSVFRRLANEGIIAPVGVTLTDGAFFQERVRNAGGNPIGVWRIRNATLARTLLERHTPAPVTTAAQLEFARA